VKLTTCLHPVQSQGKYISTPLYAFIVGTKTTVLLLYQQQRGSKDTKKHFQNYVCSKVVFIVHFILYCKQGMCQ